MITPGTTDNTLYSHHSMLRTVEDNWNLGNLGNGDASATSLFSSSTSQPTSPSTSLPTSSSALIFIVIILFLIWELKD
jgi:hypothetical protein